MSKINDDHDDDDDIIDKMSYPSKTSLLKFVSYFRRLSESA